jgi:hypothetical protein
MATNSTRSTGRMNGIKEVYRPRGRPADVELSDSDEDDPENSVQVETSVAHKRLAEIAQQRKRAQPALAEMEPPHPVPDAGTRQSQPLQHHPSPVGLSIHHAQLTF